MSSLYLNRLSKEQREGLVATLLNSQSGNCFICGKTIELAVHGVDIDHIEPTKVGGKDGPENFAATHESCNRMKKASDLRVARILASFDQISESISEENRAPNLGDILARNNGSKYELAVHVDGDMLKTSFTAVGRSDVLKFPVYNDDLSGFKYAFMNLPIEYIHHDDHINPRAIGKNLKKLVEEFHKKLPQLHVALGWIDTGEASVKVRVFDGQHKAAAQVLLGANHLPVRIFLNPDRDALLTANTHAGTTLRQVAFDKSVQRNLGSALLADRMDRYRKEHDLVDDYEGFSEHDLVNHFRGETREIKRYILDWVRNSVTTHQDNKLRDYIDYGGRGTEMPVSYSTVEKTFYSFFIHNGSLTTPFNYRVEEGSNPRQLEVEQIVRLMNIIAEKVFIGQFEHPIGTKRIEFNIRDGKSVPEPHLRAFRMAKEEILYNWVRYAGQIVQNYFIMTGKPIDPKKLFQYTIPNDCWKNIENFVENLKRLSIWVNKDLSIFGGKQNYDYWQSVFESGKTSDEFEVMPTGIDLMEMIRPHGVLASR